MRYIPDYLARAYDGSPTWSRSIASTGYGVLKNAKENTREFRGYLRALEESQWWDRSRLMALQHDRLRKLIRHVSANVPYYRKLFVDHGISPTQIQTPDDLAKLPILRKETVRHEFKDLLAPGFEFRRLRREVTSGTKGSPLTVWMNDEPYLQARAAQWLHHKWAGYHHREWIGILAGYRVVPLSLNRPPFWITNYAGKQVHFSTQHLRQGTFVEYVKKISTSGIEYLLGYPSAIGLLARHMVLNRQTIPLRGVFLGSEPVYHWQEEAIQKAFLCRASNFYSQAERVLSAVGCEFRSNLHINMEITIAEYLPNPNPSGSTFLVGTSLTNYAMPLIRYELEDVAERVPGPCPCGRHHDLIKPVDTHADSYIVAQDGSLIPPSLLYFPLQRVRGIIASQIVQETVSNFVVNVVANEEFSEHEAEMLKREIRGCIGGHISIAIREVEDIPRTTGGKFKFVVSNIANDVASEKNKD